MHWRKQVLICVVALLGAAPCFSQLHLGAELRPRFLVDMGYGTPRVKTSPPRIFVTQRTRLNALFASDRIDTYISIQDVRYWGGDNNFKASGTFGNTGSMSLHQGWVLFRLAPRISLKAGRQLLAYDDQRIIASRGWNDAQVTYDAVLVKAGSSTSQVDLGLTWNAEADRYAVISPRKFKTFDFVRYQGTWDQLKFSAIMLLSGNTLDSTSNLVRYGATWGTSLNYQGAVSARGSLYYQHHLNQVAGQWSAFCGSFLFTLPGAGERTRWSAGLDYISGQDATRDDPDYQETNHAFHLLYGRRHGWYGYMDYFSTMPAQGLQDYMLKAEFRLSPKMLLQTDYHYFRLASAMPDPENTGEAVSKQLGHELDLTLKWTLSKEAALQAGWSFLASGRTLELVKGADPGAARLNSFAYLMITLTPGFDFESPDRGEDVAGKP